MSKPNHHSADAQRARWVEEAETRLEDAAAELWALGVDEDDLVEHLRAAVSAYASETERYAP